jgi:hypothetical protein
MYPEPGNGFSFIRRMSCGEINLGKISHLGEGEGEGEDAEPKSASSWGPAENMMEWLLQLVNSLLPAVNGGISP